MSRKITIIVLSVIVLLGIIVLGPVAPDLSLSGDDNKATVTVIGDYNESTGEYNIIYNGGGGISSDVLFEPSNVTVEHDGNVENWNGETRNGIIRLGSQHTVNVTDENKNIIVTFRHPNYDKDTVIELQPK